MKVKSSSNDEREETLHLVVSYRGFKVEVELQGPGEWNVMQLKEHVLKTHVAMVGEDAVAVSACDVKLLFQGKQLPNSEEDVYKLLEKNRKSGKKVFHFIALGMSTDTQRRINDEIRDGINKFTKSRLIRDDLSDKGKQELMQKKIVGQHHLALATGKFLSSQNQSSPYGFQSIQSLPNLPNQTTAEEILTSLANDVGIRACMEKRRWTVGCLAEMYPEGNVGKDPVCVMGLNQNKGQKILLRLRTDDLKGFRKILSIRKVLYHELAHNVHSEHDTAFFQLMRLVEQECTSHSSLSSTPSATAPITSFVGGSGRLGGADTLYTSLIPTRELAARAALIRLSHEEEEICHHCGSDMQIKTHGAATEGGNDNEEKNKEKT
jgi:hypothetical protein